MSWTPTIWIKKEDFLVLKSKIREVKEKNDELQAWQLNVSESEGVVFGHCETTQQSLDLHEAIKDFPHWLLSSECPYTYCENCKMWGDEIELEFM